MSGQPPDPTDRHAGPIRVGPGTRRSFCDQRVCRESRARRPGGGEYLHHVVV